MTEPAANPRQTIELDWPCTPEDLLPAWPRARRLALLWAGDAAPSQSRWCLFTEPVRRIALGRNAQREHLERFFSPAAAPLPGDPDLPPFRSGWFATVSYDF
ncbi:MAG: hypothetical protein ACOYN0_02625, partial [Phycisphaerales bacterium]